MVSESLGVTGKCSELAECGRSALGRTGIVSVIGDSGALVPSERSSRRNEGVLGVVDGDLRRT